MEDIQAPTPLISSEFLTQKHGFGRILLKLENTNVSGSFKDRPMLSLGKYYQKTLSAPHLVCPSGGNAGLACAYAAHKLGVPATIILPELPSESPERRVKEKVMRKMRQFGASVLTKGEDLPAAIEAAMKYVEDENKLCEERSSASESSSGGSQTFVLAPPFDHQAIWDGNKEIIMEIAAQMAPDVPDALVLSVGGGGLAAGIYLGLRELASVDERWNKTKVFLVETEGAGSMQLSISKKCLSSLDKVQSIAGSLAAKQVAAKAFELARDHPGGSFPVLVSDKDSVHGIQEFLCEHNVLLEPACGVNFSALGKQEVKAQLSPSSTVVVIVCGGSVISPELLTKYEHQYGVLLASL